MFTYVGYGFDTTNLTDEEWANLAKKYDNITECSIEAACVFIDDTNFSRAEYLKNIINENEGKTAGTDYIVSTYDNYIIFDSARFADDSPRTRYIRTQQDFISMIARYVPTVNLAFGNLYEGNDWLDPTFVLD